MDLGLKGRVAVVAGSSQGLGRAIADVLAQEGAALMINSRSAAKLAVVRDEIVAATGARVEAFACDLSEPAGAEQLIAAAQVAFGKVDILVTNTGGPPAGMFEDHSPEVWRQAIAQNFESVVNLVRAALPGMKERRWGRIVNVTSISVKQPVEGLILSNSLRAGVTGFAKTISNEVARYNVTVNNVLPGYTRTERLIHLAEAVSERDKKTVDEAYEGWAAEIPMGRLAEPPEVGAVAAFLCSEQASYVTGQSIAVDGGWIKGLV
ncbi:MAG: SDR family oxidoreductase [Gemmatimonadetes bacterium]|nr:SDR family oxidoreductase [Gemmatimonadota bacterium]MDA1104125.1 SDR family oxidoreductase [Gemmatimonadota bacterium]